MRPIITASHAGWDCEAFLAFLHLAAQVGAGVEPVAGRVLRLVTGGTHVVELVGQAIVWSVPALTIGVLFAVVIWKANKSLDGV